MPQIENCLNNGIELFLRSDCYIASNCMEVRIYYPHAGIQSGPHAPYPPSTNVYPTVTDWWTQTIYRTSSDPNGSNPDVPCPFQNWNVSKCRAKADPADAIGVLPSNHMVCTVQQLGNCGWPDADGGFDSTNPDFIYTVRINPTCSGPGDPSLLWSDSQHSPGYEVVYQ